MFFVDYCIIKTGIKIILPFSFRYYLYGNQDWKNHQPAENR